MKNILLLQTGGTIAMHIQHGKAELNPGPME
jgi:L-asparaginase/Glu-tRNA(Gln) amidotransferase subunit D